MDKATEFPCVKSCRFIPPTQFATLTLSSNRPDRLGFQGRCDRNDLSEISSPHFLPLGLQQLQNKRDTITWL
jgi:hypothetical protein